MYNIVWDFLVEHFFSFTNIRDVLPCSYGLFIFWKSNSMFFFTGSLSKVDKLISFFKRLNLDDFFFSRLSAFLDFFQGQTFLLRALASCGTGGVEDFLDEGQKVSFVLGQEFLERQSLEVDPLDTVGMPVVLKLRMLFYFHLRDLIFKHLC